MQQLSYVGSEYQFNKDECGKLTDLKSAVFRRMRSRVFIYELTISVPTPVLE